MKILVLGAGAVGGYFGGRLVEAGADVTFLVRPRRAAQLAEHGLVVKSAFGDIRHPVATILSQDLAETFDLVILTCKAYDLDAAIDAVAPAVGADTAVLPLLNGLAHLAALDERFGAGRVLGGMCHLAGTLTPEGEIHHLNQLQALTLGDRSGARSPSCELLAAVLAASPVTVRLSDDILQDMWEKFVMLTSLAAVTCLMRASVGDIMAATEGETITLEVLDECAKVAAAAGHAPRPDSLNQARKLLTERGSGFTASMLRDIEQGGPIEADHTAGDMLRRGRASGVATPHLRLAWCHLQAYEARRARDQGAAGQPYSASSAGP